MYPNGYEATNVLTELCEVNIKGKQTPGVLNLNPVYFKKVCYFVLGYLLLFCNESLNDIVYSKEYEVANIFTELCEFVIQDKPKPYI